jgi:hypothetical protein
MKKEKTLAFAAYWRVAVLRSNGFGCRSCLYEHVILAPWLVPR